jgi:DNA ligase 1
MATIKRPMLAAKTTRQQRQLITYPKLGSNKLDGIRCIVINSVALSRNKKKLPNKHVQELFGRPEFEGLDGELIVGKVTAPDVFNVTQSAVMKVEGKPKVVFYVFDDFTDLHTVFYSRNSTALQRAQTLANCKGVKHVVLKSFKEMMDFHEKALKAGFEGSMLRHPDAPYKEGKSTLKQQWLVKLKEFEDSEAVVLGCYELMKTSKKTTKLNELGYKSRSHKKEDKVPANQLGGLHVQDLKTKQIFDVGSGFSLKARKSLWKLFKKSPDTIVGAKITYRYQPAGVKELPRFPTFKGFRNEIDF